MSAVRQSYRQPEVVKTALETVFKDGSVILRGYVNPEEIERSGVRDAEMRIVWVNPKQNVFCRDTRNTKVLVAGRGFGKSAMLALQFAIWMVEMPRAKSYLAAVNLTQAKNETLAVIQDIWGVMGFKRGRDYVVGEKPPKTWTKFKAAYIAPENYDNCVTWKNGFTIVLISSVQIKTKRGGNYDCGVIDEAAFVDEKVFSQVLSKATRANPFRFTSPYHHQKVIVTSRPRDIKGQWVSDMEQKAAASPDKIYYDEASARENPYLTDEWFENELATSGLLEFLIEVENEKVDRLPDGFYHQFDKHKHIYTPTWQYIGGCKYDAHYNPKAVLDITFDFGGWFSCCSVIQDKDNMAYLQKQFYVDKNERIKQLVDKICDYYKHQEHKVVRMWGEPRGRDKNATDVKDIYEQMAERFAYHGWGCLIKAPKGHASPDHKVRYEELNSLLAEDSPSVIRLRINGVDAKDVAIAMQLCDRTSGFQKNKSMEKNKLAPQLHAPHFTDTWDYYAEQKHGIGRKRRMRRLGKRAG